MPHSLRETVLWLIRHPETHHPARSVCYGSLDVPLSEAGIQHAGAIAQALAGGRFDAIYTSPSQRCMHTAAKIASGRSCIAQPVDALRELNFGAFEGLSYDEISARSPDLYRDWMERPTETQFPGGEIFSQLSARVLGFTRTVLAQDAARNIVFVTHAGPIRAILADALGMSARNIFRIAQRYGAVNRIRYCEGVPVVELINGS